MVICGPGTFCLFNLAVEQDCRFVYVSKPVAEGKRMRYKAKAKHVVDDNSSGSTVCIG